MAHFRAVIQGNRGVASRLGTKASGIFARVQSWGYDVVVDVQHVNGEDWALITRRAHDASDTASRIARVNLTTGEVLQ